MPLCRLEHQLELKLVKHMGWLSRCMLIALFVSIPLMGVAQTKAQPTSESAANTAANAQKKANAGLDPIARRVNQLADELRSPFCPGKTLMTCTSSRAYDLRREMEAMAREGKSNQEIIAELKTKYGDDVSNPTQPWYTFFVPFLPFIVLGGLLFWVVRRWRTRGEEHDVGSADFGKSVNSTTNDGSPDNDAADEAEKLAKLRARMWQDD